MQGKRLVRLQDDQNYPLKIKKLMEDVRFAKERQAELTGRLHAQKKSTIKLRNKVADMDDDIREAEESEKIIDATNAL